MAPLFGPLSQFNPSNPYGPAAPYNGAPVPGFRPQPSGMTGPTVAKQRGPIVTAPPVKYGEEPFGPPPTEATTGTQGTQRTQLFGPFNRIAATGGQNPAKLL